MSFAAFALLGLLSVNSFALVTPDAGEMKRLQTLVDDARNAQTDYEEALRRVERGQFEKSDADHYRELRAKMWKRAMDGILIGYGMALPDAANPGRARLPKMPFAWGKFEGQTRNWVIAFGDLPLAHYISEQTDPKAFKRYKRHRDEASAITMPEGTTVVFRTDYKTPAELAFTLFHERSHYDQLADPAFKDSTIAEREVVSWRLGLDNMTKFGFTEDELKIYRPAAGKMLVKESLKAVSARGARNLGLFGKWIRDALPRADEDARQELDSSVEGITLDAEKVAALRKDAERIAGEVDQESKVRELLGVAEEICANPNRITYDDPLRAKYRRVEPVAGDAPQASPDACLQEVFELLWKSKAEGDRNADWNRAADIALRYTERTEYHASAARGARPEAAAALPPAPAVAAQIAQPMQAAQAWTTDYALNLLASKGCADPWALNQADLDRHWSGLLGTPFDDGAVARLGLQGCQDRLFKSLMAMAAQRLPAQLTQEMFARTAEAARNPAPAYVPDDMPDIPGAQAPTVPTCRHHPWCQQWRGDGR